MWACSLVLVTEVLTTATDKHLLRNPYLVLFGGRDPEAVHNATYTLDLGSNYYLRLLTFLETLVWTKLQDKAECLPAPRCAAGMTNNYNHGILFGGDSNGRNYLNDIWILQFNKMLWKYQPTRGATPAGRSAHCQAIVNNCLWVFGGTNGDYVFNDMHQLDLDTWTWKCIVVDELTAPPPRYGCSMTSVGKSKKINICYVTGVDLIILGGDSKDQLTKIWSFDTEKLTWSSVDTAESQAPPTKFFGHTTVNFNKKLYIFGGQDEDSYSKNLYILDHSFYQKRLSLSSMPATYLR
jgi:N-acetylneuraminic acid mutarotase